MPSPAKTSQGLGSNFAHLQAHDEQLLRLGMLAERYFAEDPNTCLLKLRQLSEVLAQMVASNVGVFERPEEGQYDLLNRLRDHGILPYEIHQLFGEVRRTGNAANHSLAGDHRTALATLKIAWQLGVWFHRTFGEPKFKSGPFVPPRPPANETDELRTELETLAKELTDYQAAHHEKSLQLGALEEQLKTAKDEQSFWESMATEAEAEKAALQARLVAKQAETVTTPAQAVASLVQASTAAANDVHLDEAATRRLIDEQLRQAGWIVDSENLRFSKGARPQKGKNMAIAEWPTATGPADYVLFVGLLPLGAVEAKRKNVNVSSSLQQAKRYSRGFEPSGEIQLHDQNWGTVGEFRLPFVFSTNGRPWLRQLSTHSGIWFCDLRRPDNLGDALQGWFSPEGLLARFKQDEVAAHERLAQEIFDYGFTVRPYQQDAILATETAIGEGRRAILLAMATGTGKTKTCIALIYRLLKAKRFRQSVLAAATSGKLTEEWRVENGVSDEWETIKLGGLLTDIRYGTAKKCRYEPIATPVLRIPNIGVRQVTLDDIKYAEFDPKEIRTLALKSGDLLVIRSNGSVELVGRIALVSEREAGYLYAGYVIRLRIDGTRAIPSYVALSLRNPATRAIIELNARSSSGVNNINTEEIKALAINLPSLPEQQEIVRRVEDLFAFADRIEARLATAQKTVERLTPATLAKAFRGEPVPQDPADEPADELLERLAASSGNTPKTKRRSGRR